MSATRDLSDSHANRLSRFGERPAAGDESPPAYKLALSDEQAFVQVDRDWLFPIAASVLREEHVRTAQMSFALVDDAAIRRINRRYLGHDFATDVISFPLYDNDAEHRDVTKRIEGEIIISGETAARVAAEFDRPPSEEVALYVVHGLLHLCGFDDQDGINRERMHERQQWHLKKFGIQPHY